MLDGASRRDAKLPARVTTMLMGSVRAVTGLDLYGPMSMASIERVWRLKGMGIGVL